MRLSLNKTQKNSVFDYGTHKVKDNQVTGLFLTIIVISSIMFLFSAQVIMPTVGPGFKIFYDLFKFSITMIGLPFSAISLSHGMWTPHTPTYKEWWRKTARRALMNYYYYIIIFALIGLIVLGVLNGMHSKFFPGYKYYALIPTVAALPLQNFSQVGTTFTIALLWFNLLFPFINKFFNKLNFTQALVFIGFLLLVAAFIGSWNNVFSHYHNLDQLYPWHAEVTKYLKVEVIFAYLFLGMFIRKFIKNGNPRTNLIIWIVMFLALFIIETGLNYGLNHMGVYLSMMPGEIMTTIMVCFAFQYLSGVSFHHRFTVTIHHKRIAWINKTAILLIGDMFIMVLPISHFVVGLLIGHLALHMNVSVIGSTYYILYPQTQVLITSPIPIHVPWILMFGSCLIFIPLAVLGSTKIILFNVIEKKLKEKDAISDSKKKQIIELKK